MEMIVDAAGDMDGARPADHLDLPNPCARFLKDVRIKTDNYLVRWIDDCSGR
jgi:hypothetical protein